MSVAYRERAHLVALLAAIYPSSIEVDPAQPDWPLVQIELPTGQASWHISPDDMSLFDHVKRGGGREWDGHSMEEKYARIDALTVQLSDSFEIEWKGLPSGEGVYADGTPFVVGEPTPRVFYANGGPFDTSEPTPERLERAYRFMETLEGDEHLELLQAQAHG